MSSGSCSGTQFNVVAFISDGRSTWRYHQAGEKGKQKQERALLLHISRKAKHSGKNRLNRMQESVVELMVLEVIVKVKDCRRYRQRTSSTKKHNKSRRPSSWREKNITKSKDEAIGELKELRDAIVNTAKEDTDRSLRQVFEEYAESESDCSSAKRKGDLGPFGKGKMQPSLKKRPLPWK